MTECEYQALSLNEMSLLLSYVILSYVPYEDVS